MPRKAGSLGCGAKPSPTRSSFLLPAQTLRGSAPSSTHVVHAVMRVLPPLLGDTGALEVDKHRSSLGRGSAPTSHSHTLRGLPHQPAPSLHSRRRACALWGPHSSVTSPAPAVTSRHGLLSPALLRAGLRMSANGLSPCKYTATRVTSLRVGFGAEDERR